MSETTPHQQNRETVLAALECLSRLTGTPGTIRQPLSLLRMNQAVEYVKTDSWPEASVKYESHVGREHLVTVTRTLGHGLELHALVKLYMCYEPPYNGGREEPRSPGGWDVEECEVVSRKLYVTPITFYSLGEDNDGDDILLTAAQSWAQEQPEEFFNDETDNNPFPEDET